MRSKTNNQVECNKTRARSSKEHWSPGLSFQSHSEWLYQQSWSSLSSQTNHKLMAATHSCSILLLCLLAAQNCLKTRKIFALRGHNGFQDELSCFQSFPLSSLTIYFTSGLWVPELSYLSQSWGPIEVVSGRILFPWRGPWHYLILEECYLLNVWAISDAAPVRSKLWSQWSHNRVQL